MVCARQRSLLFLLLLFLHAEEHVLHLPIAQDLHTSLTSMRDSGELESVTGNSPRVLIPPSPLAFSQSQEPLQITRLTRMQANTPSLPKRLFPHNSTTQTKLSYRAQKHPPLTRPPTELRTTAQNQSPSSSLTNQNSVPAHTTRRRRWTLSLSLSLSLTHTHTKLLPATPPKAPSSSTAHSSKL